MEVVKLFVAHGAKINSISFYGQTILISKSPPFFKIYFSDKILIMNKENIFSLFLNLLNKLLKVEKEEKEIHVLIFYFRNGHVDVVNFLLKSGADMTFSPRKKSNALCAAIENRHTS